MMKINQSLVVKRLFAVFGSLFEEQNHRNREFSFLTTRWRQRLNNFYHVTSYGLFSQPTKFHPFMMFL